MGADIMIITCTTCGFQVPYDLIGLALMKQHLLDDHGLRTKASQKAKEARDASD